MDSEEYYNYKVIVYENLRTGFHDYFTVFDL